MAYPFPSTVMRIREMHDTFYAGIVYRAHWISRSQYLIGDTHILCTFYNISEVPTIVTVPSRSVILFCLTDGQPVYTDIIINRRRQV
jgi:hypothetical protein